MRFSTTILLFFCLAYVAAQTLGDFKYLYHKESDPYDAMRLADFNNDGYIDCYTELTGNIFYGGEFGFDLGYRRNYPHDEYIRNNNYRGNVYKVDVNQDGYPDIVYHTPVFNQTMSWQLGGDTSTSVPHFIPSGEDNVFISQYMRLSLDLDDRYKCVFLDLDGNFAIGSLNWEEAQPQATLETIAIQESEPIAAFGLLTSNGQRRLAYRTIDRVFLESPDGSIFVVDGASAIENTWVERGLFGFEETIIVQHEDHTIRVFSVEGEEVTQRLEIAMNAVDAGDIRTVNIDDDPDLELFLNAYIPAEQDNVFLYDFDANVSEQASMTGSYETSYGSFDDVAFGQISEDQPPALLYCTSDNIQVIDLLTGNIKSTPPPLDFSLRYTTTGFVTMGGEPYIMGANLLPFSDQLISLYALGYGPEPYLYPSQPQFSTFNGHGRNLNFADLTFDDYPDTYSISRRISSDQSNLVNFTVSTDDIPDYQSSSDVSFNIGDDAKNLWFRPVHRGNDATETVNGVIFHGNHGTDVYKIGITRYENGTISYTPEGYSLTIDYPGITTFRRAFLTDIDGDQESELAILVEVGDGTLYYTFEIENDDQLSLISQRPLFNYTMPDGWTKIYPDPDTPNLFRYCLPDGKVYAASVTPENLELELLTDDIQILGLYRTYLMDVNQDERLDLVYYASSAEGISIKLADENYAYGPPTSYGLLGVNGFTLSDQMRFSTLLAPLDLNDDGVDDLVFISRDAVFYSINNLLGSENEDDDEPETIAADEITAYPNPVDDQFKITTEKDLTPYLAEGIVGRIYNTSGELEQSVLINDLAASINVSQLPLGVYIITLFSRDDERIESGRFMIIR